MEKAKKHIFSYYQLHVFIYSQAIVPIVIFIMNHITGDYTGGHRGEQLIAEGIILSLFFIVNKCFYKMEIKDELVQYNLARANKITFIVVITAMFAGVLLNDYFMNGVICSDFCWLIVMGAIALRSMLYMFFDAPSKKNKEEEE